MSEQEMDMEELVLRESIVSAAGINASSLQIGIRGDPSMRETTVERTARGGRKAHQLEIMP